MSTARSDGVATRVSERVSPWLSEELRRKMDLVLKPRNRPDERHSQQGASHTKPFKEGGAVPPVRRREVVPLLAVPERTRQRWQQRRLLRVRAADALDPRWRVTRPYGDGSFLQLEAGVEDRAERSTPNGATLEECLVDDLVNALMGVPATDGAVLVQALPDGSASCGVRFLLRRDAHGHRIPDGISAMAEPLLQLATDVSTLDEFAEECSFYVAGVVRNALGAALRQLLAEHLQEMACFGAAEAKSASTMTVQRLWLALQPRARVVAAVRRVFVDGIPRECGGGQLLGVLYERLRRDGGSGEAAIQAVLQPLFTAACAPWLRMLRRWVDDGQLDDAHAEFWVEAHTAVRPEQVASDFNSNFWERWYVLRHAQVPETLQELSVPILTAGKYRAILNSVDDAGALAEALPGEGAVLAFARDSIAIYVERRLAGASRALLEVVLRDGDLQQRLHTLKRLFLFERSDVLLDVMERAGTATLTAAYVDGDTVCAAQQTECLQEALTSAWRFAHEASADAPPVSPVLLPYSMVNQLLRVLSVSDAFVPLSSEEAAELAAATHPTKTRDAHLTVIEALALEYEAPWPTSLVLNRRVLTKYQLLFRQLLSLQWLARRLANTWHGWRPQKSAMHHGADGSAPHHGDVARLVGCTRREMLDLLQTLLRYMTIDVIEARWSALLGRLQEASRGGEGTPSLPSIDELMQVHQEFLDTCLKECLMTHIRLLKALRQVTKACQAFVDACQRCEQAATVAEEVPALPPWRARQRTRRAIDFTAVPDRTPAGPKEHQMQPPGTASPALPTSGDVSTWLQLRAAFHGAAQHLSHTLLAHCRRNADPRLRYLCERLTAWETPQ
ncbi:hypothetical protein CDCA_CDCA09G2821 [Cyanidium caldarium]|uniref:Spindle pole body component n=1 Tax=Cyanidium caldarium TaxID=2771 RepID=A0AAV9IXC0_CYACA|nr:hypothetical protein CDCA_CDCA09G2821 [Cyanidium caldarium]